MSQPAVKWKDARRFFRRNGFEINNTGGDVIIIRDGKTHRIGHKYCHQPGCELSKGHLSAIERKFGVTRDDILAG